VLTTFYFLKEMVLTTLKARQSVRAPGQKKKRNKQDLSLAIATNQFH